MRDRPSSGKWGHRLIGGLDAFTGRVAAAGKWLAIPVVVLLFVQWPLRDLVKAWSREANDLGQWLFALFIAVAVTAATRARLHLSADAFTHRYAPTTLRRLRRLAAVLVLIPWSLFVLVVGWPTVLRSVGELERFGDTGNPGYFIVKCAMLLLAGLVFLQALIDLLRPDGAD